MIYVIIIVNKFEFYGDKLNYQKVSQHVRKFKKYDIIWFNNNFTVYMQKLFSTHNIHV